MKRWQYIWIFFTCCFLTGFAQPVLHGRVITFDTHKPVALANVFLSNTSLGKLTDERGEFTITKFPSGRYDLVVSFIGYETYSVQLESAHLPDSLEIILKPKVIELQEVIVESYDKDGWEKWGNIFLMHFMGTSQFAEQCRLLNKGTLKFRFNKKINLLRVSADEPLVIENKALGYVLRYSLAHFEYNFNEHIFFYGGYPFFEQMKTNRAGLQKKWIENREFAYYGSLLHFMRSLYRNQLIEQGFDVRKKIILTEVEKARVTEIVQQAKYKRLPPEGFSTSFTKPSPMNDPDSVGYFRKVDMQVVGSSLLLDKVLTADSIAYSIDSMAVELSFSGHMGVWYPAKVFPSRYPGNSGLFFARAISVNSDIFLPSGKPVIIFSNGTYANGENLLTDGYWAWWEKMANKLPYEYWPPKKESPNQKVEALSN